MGIALDAVAGKIFWAANCTSPWAGKLRRSNLDGSDIEDLVTMSAFYPKGIALDLRLPGDCDGDGDITLSDHGWFVGCMAGPGASFAAGCSCADLNYDGYIDLADFAALQAAFTGPLP